MKKYRSILLASLVALSGTAQASGNSQLSDDEITDIRVECISAGIADEVEDDQLNGFVEQCVSDGILARQRFKGWQQQSATL